MDKRCVSTPSGDFIFIQKNKNNMPVIDVWFEDKFIGCMDYLDIINLSDLELIQAVDEFIDENDYQIMKYCSFCGKSENQKEICGESMTAYAMIFNSKKMLYYFD